MSCDGADDAACAARKPAAVRVPKGERKPPLPWPARIVAINLS
jgi:hypothetical protein